MKVICIVVNLYVFNFVFVDWFYCDIFGLYVVMDYGWICIYVGDDMMVVQFSIVLEGGLGIVVFDFFIEVDDLDEVLCRVFQVGILLVYGLVNEFWGVWWFYVCDLLGWLVNFFQYV